MIPSILPTYNRATLSFVKGEGSWLIEADGRRFLDLGAGLDDGAGDLAGAAFLAVVVDLYLAGEGLHLLEGALRLPIPDLPSSSGASRLDSESLDRGHRNLGEWSSCPPYA